MLTTILGLGSVWEEMERNGKWSFYNTTGIEIEGRYRPRWKLGGKIRFNNIPGCDQKSRHRLTNRIYSCEPPTVRTPGGWPQILVKHLLNGATIPDNYLVRVQSDVNGVFVGNVEESVSDDTKVIAFSECQTPEAVKQESLFLMRRFGWIATNAGTWILMPREKQEWSADLRLENNHGEIS